MAWNASGTFNRIVTTVSPAVGGTTIDVADQNSYTADVTAGINACLAKNGENAATGDIDLGSNQLKAVADGTLATDAPNVGQVQDGSFVYQGTVTGTADAIEMTLTPTLTAYAAGQVFRFLADDTCSGDGVTLDVDGLGALDVLTNSIADPRAGDISLNGIYTVVCDGSRFLLQNPERETDGVFVNNSNGNSNIDDTAFAINSLADSDWETVGPTGTADNDFSSLDALPDDIDWVEIKIFGSVTVTGVNAGIEVYARDGVGSQAAGLDNLIFFTDITATTGANGITAMSTAKVPVDAKTFALRYVETGSIGQLIAVLTGYGWN